MTRRYSRLAMSGMTLLLFIILCVIMYLTRNLQLRTPGTE